MIRMGRVNFAGVVKRVCLDYVPEINVGDYAIVHVGFAISVVDEKTAQETLETFRAMGVLDEELASEEEEEAWFTACRLLGDLYLSELSRPDLAVPCYQDFRQSAKSGPLAHGRSTDERKPR